MKPEEKEFLERIEQHKGMLFKLSKIYQQNPENQKDLFQDMVVQLWRSYDSFRSESQFSTWMYRVCLNTALSFYKKEKKKFKTSDIQNIEIKDDTDETHKKENQLHYFYQAVQELNDIEKALIFLLLEGVPQAEIAQNLGISEGNTRVKINRTKEKLQQIIKKLGYEF